jgi:hypothetical protein
MEVIQSSQGINDPFLLDEERINDPFPLDGGRQGWG